MIITITISLSETTQGQIKGNVLKKAIEEAWAVDGVRDTHKIAHKLGCTVQYVRRVLKPIRDKERKEIEEKVRKIRNKGMSVRDIARKVGLSRSKVHRIIGTLDAQSLTG